MCLHLATRNGELRGTVCRQPKTVHPFLWQDIALTYRTPVYEETVLFWTLWQMFLWLLCRQQEGTNFKVADEVLSIAGSTELTASVVVINLLCNCG